MIHFYLNGYDFQWKSKNYVFNISEPNKPGACMGMNRAYGTKITLGSIWMIGHDIIFDLDNNLLGFAEAECYQNKYINLSNGLELNEEEMNSKYTDENSLIIETKNDYQNYIKKVNASLLKENNSFIEKFRLNNKNIIDILLFISISLLIILISLSLLLIFKFCKNNKYTPLKTNNKYIEVYTNNIVN